MTTSSAQFILWEPWLQLFWSPSALPVLCSFQHAAGASKQHFPGSFASRFLHRFGEWETLNGDRRADGKDWYTSHLFPHSMPTSLLEVTMYVMAPHLSKWLHFPWFRVWSHSLGLVAHKGSTLVAFWLSGSILPTQLLGSSVSGLLFLPLTLWR